MINRHALTHSILPAAGGRPGTSTFTSLAYAGPRTAKLYGTSSLKVSYHCLSSRSPSATSCTALHSSTSHSFGLSLRNPVLTQRSTTQHKAAFHSSQFANAAQINVDNTTTQPKNPSRTSPCNIRVLYQARPRRDQNPLMFPKTTEILSNDSHPMHKILKQRWTAFDPREKLHWRVNCFPTVSKKPVVRGWARRRVKQGFLLALREMGWGPEGKVVRAVREAVDGGEQDGGSIGDRGREVSTRSGVMRQERGERPDTPSGPLVGLLLLNVHDTSVITASWDEVKAACRAALRTTLEKQSQQDRALKDGPRARFGAQTNKGRSEKFDARANKGQNGKGNPPRKQPLYQKGRQPSDPGLLSW